MTRAAMRLGSLLALFWMQGSGASLAGEVVIETRELRVSIGSTGEVRSLQARSLGEEFGGAPEDNPLPAFVVMRGAESWPASAVALEGDTLTVRFDGASVTATMKVVQTDDYVALTLAACTSTTTRPTRTIPT